MSFLVSTGLSRFNPAQKGVGGMRAAATGMLAAMAVLFVIANNLDEGSIFWGYVKAFAEAAMVGGLADWFAVTALFRHPLGIPIPHTAIIPRNKDRIGDTLALFLKDNFLTPSVVARRMRGLDVAGALGKFLTDPPGQGRMREGATGLFATVLEALDTDQLGGMIRAAASKQLKATDVSPLLGQMLDAAVTEDRHVPVLDGIISWAGNTLEKNEEMIRSMVHDRSGWVVRFTGLDARLADGIINGLRKLAGDMAADPKHPLRVKAEESLAILAWDLQYDEAMRAKVEAAKSDLLANQAVGNWIVGLWEKARASMLEAARDPERMMSGPVGDALRALGQTLQEDERLKAMVNQYARRVTVGAVATYGSNIVSLVSETVRGWDAQTVTDRLESAVGRDLQYIRINGTVVGGLVGLIIHSVEMWT